MRRVVYLAVGGIFLINTIGLFIVCINFFRLRDEIEKILLINKSFLIRTEVFERSLYLNENLKRGNPIGIRKATSELRDKLSDCFNCHHREEISAREPPSQLQSQPLRPPHHLYQLLK